MIKPHLTRAALLVTVLALSARGASPSWISTGGAGGSYPPATSFAGVAVNGIQAGFGADVDGGGTGRGQFCAVLLGVSSLGLEQRIKIEGEVVTTSQPAADVVTLSGTAIIDMGDGLPPAEGIPFTATISAGGGGPGTIGLITGLASLPDVTIDQGSLTVR